MLTIALDFDGTYTENPQLWASFVQEARKQKCRVIMVTMRYPSEGLVGREMDIPATGLFPAEDIFYTCRKAKKQFLKDLGVSVNIWIDDHPQSVFLDAEQIWGVSLPEGQTDSRNAVR